MAQANLLAILIAAICGFLVGGVWYGPLFGKAWYREVGLTEDNKTPASVVKTYAIAFLFSLLSAMFLGHLLAHFDTDFYRTMMISVGISGGFIIPAIGTTYVFGRKSGTLFAIDAGYWIAFYAAMGLVFGFLGA